MATQILQENLYQKAEELEDIRIKSGVRLSQLHKKMRELGSQYAFSSVNNFRISPTEKLLTQIEEALQVLVSENQVNTEVAA